MAAPEKTFTTSYTFTDQLIERCEADIARVCRDPLAASAFWDGDSQGFSMRATKSDSFPFSGFDPASRAVIDESQPWSTALDEPLPSPVDSAHFETVSLDGMPFTVGMVLSSQGEVVASQALGQGEMIAYLGHLTKITNTLR